MKTQETERLILRNFHPDDWADLHRIISWYMSSELAQYDYQWPTAEAEIQKITEWFASGDSHLAVCLKMGRQLIGFVALNPEMAVDEKVYNLGYVFHFNYHGRGYASEGCMAALSYASEENQAARMISGTAAANSASGRLLGRLGFRMTSQNLMSFKVGVDGRPIEFTGCSYELSGEDWRAAGIFPVN